MYLFFDKTGVLKEIVQDSAMRMGDDESKRIYIYLEDNPIIEDIWFTLKKPDNTTGTEKSIKLNVVEKEIPYDKKRDMRYFKDYKKYKFYYKELDSTETDVSGLALGTIRAVVGGKIYAQGLITFNIEENVIKIDNLITQSQYDYLISYVSSFAGRFDLYLPLTGGTLTGDLTIEKDLLNVTITSNGIYFNGASGINFLDGVFKVGDADSLLHLYGSEEKLKYNDKDLALDEDVQRLNCLNRFNRCPFINVKKFNKHTGIVRTIFNPNVVVGWDDGMLHATGVFRVYVKPTDCGGK